MPVSSIFIKNHCPLFRVEMVKSPSVSAIASIALSVKFKKTRSIYSLSTGIVNFSLVNSLNTVMCFDLIFSSTDSMIFSIILCIL